MTEKRTSKDAAFSILDPYGIKPELKISPLTAPRPDTLEDKTVYVFGVTGGLMAEIARILQEFAAGVNVVFWDLSAGSPQGWPYGRGRLNKEIAENAEAGIVGPGDWVGSCVTVCNTAALMEQAGIPTVSTYTHPMSAAFDIQKIDVRMPDLRLYVTPVPTEYNVQDFARELVPKLVEGLTTPLTEKEKAGGIIPKEKRPRIAFTGTYEECLAFLEEYADGSSVTLPTPELVAKMLTGTSHSPDEVIGIMPPEGREITVGKVAINAVMAGCKPEYMPVVLAFAKMLSAEGARLSKGGVPNIWPVVSGPITEEIGMDSTSLMGGRNLANISIGRAVSLMYLNFGGRLGSDDYNFFDKKVSAFAENIDSPWTLLGEDADFRRDQSVICNLSGGNPDAQWHSANLYKDEGPEMYLKRLSRQIARMGVGGEYPVIVMSSTIAQDISTQLGMTKEDVKQWLYDNTFWTKEEYEWRAWRDRPMPPKIAALPGDALIRVIGSPYNYRSEMREIEDRPDGTAIVVAVGERPYTLLCKGNESPYRRWIEPVDVWR